MWLISFSLWSFCFSLIYFPPSYVKNPFGCRAEPHLYNTIPSPLASASHLHKMWFWKSSHFKFKVDFFPPQIPPPWQQQVNQTQDGGAKTHCEPAVESYVHVLRSAARRPQQCLPRAHCVGQRSPGQQCFPGRSQARSWHRCVFSLIRSKSCSKFQTRWLKTSEMLHGSLCTKELRCNSTGGGWCCLSAGRIYAVILTP